MLDAVRVTIRRDGTVNSAVPLFFGRVFGARRADVIVVATAVLRPTRVLRPGNGILPIAVDIEEWNATKPGEDFVMYGDGRFEDGNGNTRPGNWGTVDIGDTANYTDDLRDQMIEGLRQSDLDFMANDVGPDGEMRIPNNTELRAPVWVGGDTGLSAGMKHGLAEILDVPKIIPLIDKLEGGGGNSSEFHIVAWGVITVNKYNFSGDDKYVEITKIYAYDGNLKPDNDLSDTSIDIIDGAFASAGLVE